MRILSISIGVFSLFHPHAVTVQAEGAKAIRVHTAQSDRVLQGSESLTVSGPAHITSLDGGPTGLILSLPGKITRHYLGIVDVQPDHGELDIIVQMDLETAVASIAASEIPPGSPRAAVEAQAVVARSFLLASPPRHRHYNFCDTTHCQFLRNPPDPGSEAFRAAETTRGLILTHQGRPVVALYSAACGGHTLAQRGPDGFQYQSVSCEYCIRHPGEPIRGHRLGMCQQGACAMASRGATFRDILNHYYPGVSIETSR